MQTQHQKLTLLAFVMVAGLSPLALASGRSPDVIGMVVASSDATTEGTTLFSNSALFSGEPISVGSRGAVFLSFSPTGRAALAASTHVLFSRSKQNIVAQLLSGTLTVVKGNKDDLAVKTSKYRVTPQGEGRTEFIVALLSSKKTIIEARQGKVSITETSSGQNYTLGEGLRAELPAPATGFPDQEEGQSNVLGNTIASAGATRNGKRLPSGETVLDHDLISTGAGGRAVIQLAAANQVILNQDTSVRFERVVERVWVHLQNGSILVENTGKNFVEVTTARFHIEPASTTRSRIYVGVMTDKSTYIESLAGDVKIDETHSGQEYLLPAGRNSLVPANMSGIPGLQPLRGTPTPTTPRSTLPSHPQPPSAQRANSHGTVLILGISSAAGIAGAVVGLSRGETSGTQPLSPSTPY